MKYSCRGILDFVVAFKSEIFHESHPHSTCPTCGKYALHATYIYIIIIIIIVVIIIKNLLTFKELKGLNEEDTF